jgi:muramoyltetrapeptide carboxypeptidase
LIPARYPPPLFPGDRVGVAALSGPVDPARLSAGLAALRGLGFEPVPADNLSCCDRFHAGTDDERLGGFHALLADPSIGAVFFARGGHGLLRLLPRLDWDLLATRPRAFVGYSDLTPLLNLIPQRLGWVAFHGPMVAVDLARGLSSEEEESLLAALRGAPLSPPAMPRTVVSGVARGPLAGGCLSLLAATQGTPFAPALEGAIVFWEDVGEAAYRLDRMLTHLRLSGSLAGARGMAVGEVDFDGVDVDDEEREWEALMASCSDFRMPVSMGLRSGHRRPNLTLPIGALVELDAGRGELTVLPAAEVDIA